MERFKSITIIFLLAVGLPALAAQPKPASVLLQEGKYAEETEGDLDAAIEIYEQIVKDSSVQRPYIAEAMYRLGLCHFKKQDEQKARTIFEQIVAQFPDQSTVVDKVQALLDKIGSSDLAVLMPPDTKIYIEMGNPGRQVETILKMLKGTPFENPLAVIGGGREPGSAVGPGGKSPADIMDALLNPSTITELKKIRGCAVGITELRQNNPPLVAVLYPGKSDALRGLILGILGAAGTVGEPIEGMETLTIANTAGVAHDGDVIIIAQPRERLAWCVKQYKGITNEPTLVSQNKVFAKIAKENRQANAVTVWVDVAGTYSAVSELMAQVGQADKLRVVDGLADLKAIEDIIASLSIEETGIAIDANVNFKDDHNCLMYQLIRTPNLSRGGFEGLPSEAVAVASLALGESGGTSVETAQKAVKRLTGLSIGREIFANIEQVNLFVVPPRSTAGEGETTKHIASCFGLALTSRNPQHTHQLVTAILEVANLLAALSTNEKSVEQSNSAAGRYVLPLGHDQKIDCYIGQRNKTTILAFSGEVLDASLSAIEDKKSALTVGVLQEPLKKVTADTSKMLLINVGGAIKVADAYINMTYDNPQNPAHKTLAQLAQACGKTYVQLRTGESDDNFNLHISINQLPPLDSVFGLLMQLSKTDLTAQAKTTKPQPGDGTVMGLKEDMKLDWEPGINATSHKVYFGTAADELSFLAEVSKPVEAKLPVLQEDDRYYWRVDEVWSDGTIITGDTWSFSIGKLIGWWKFDETEGSNAHDSSGSGHTGTLLGNPRWQPARGRVGGALEFDGDGDYVNLGKKSDFDITEQITVAAWIKVNRFDKEWQAIVSKGDSSWRVQRVRETDSLEFACSGLQVPGTQWGGIYGKISVNDGQWHHATGVYDGKKLSLYVDGKLDVSVNAPGKINVNDYPVYIGENAERTGRFWNGLIDDVRVYNYALSQEEIEALCRFNASEPRPVEGAVVGPEMKVKLNWTPGIGASASKVFFGTKSDQLSPLAEVTNPAYAGLPALEKDTKYYWRIDNVQANGVVVSGDIWSFTTSGKLVGWWKLDESSGTTAHDSSGRGNHGTLIGDTQWVADGLIGGALYFNDSNDTTCRVEIPTEGMSASAGTIALQAKLSPNPPSTEVFTRYFFGHTTIPYYNNRIQLYLDQTTMTLDLGLGDSHNRKMNMAPLDVETWYHIALTWNDGTYVVYLDGQKLATGTYTGLSTINTIANIGNDGGELDEAFDGTIDDVRIYNYALGEGDILALVREN